MNSVRPSCLAAAAGHYRQGQVDRFPRAPAIRRTDSSNRFRRRPARLPPGGPLRARDQMKSDSPFPPRRRRGQVPELLGDAPLHAGAERVVLLERGDLRRVAPDGASLALLVGHVRDDGGRRPGLGAQQLRHAPGQQPGYVLVAVVLVAEPLAFGLLLAHQEAGVVHHHVIGVAQTHREEDGGRIEFGDGDREDGRHVGRRRPVGRRQVLVVGELEPLVPRFEDRHGRRVLLPPHGHHVVTGDEATQRIPLRGHVGIGRVGARPSTVTTVVSS